MIKVDHPTMNVGQLCGHIEQNTSPVRRSSHPGNQPPSELAVATLLPPGVDLMWVGTVAGDDNYGRPHLIDNGVLGTVNLTSRKKASGRVVGSVMAHDPENGNEVSLADIHSSAMHRLQPNNQPKEMMSYFGQSYELLKAVIVACAKIGSLRRAVREDGRIISIDQADNTLENQIFHGGDSVGVMLPLDGMMAMDMLCSHAEGSGRTLHLAGPDMSEYTRNPERMSNVEAIVNEALSSLGLRGTHHTYQILDVTNLGSAIQATSQYVMLETGEHMDLDPDRHKEIVLGGNDQ